MYCVDTPVDSTARLLPCIMYKDVSGDRNKTRYTTITDTQTQTQRDSAGEWMEASVAWRRLA